MLFTIQSVSTSSIPINYANIPYQTIAEIPTSIVKLPRIASRCLGNALQAEARMGVVELRVAMLFVAIASVVLREAIAEQLVITAWRRCAR